MWLLDGVVCMAKIKKQQAKWVEGCELHGFLSLEIENVFETSAKATAE